MCELILFCSASNRTSALLTVVSGSAGSGALQSQIKQALNNIGNQFIPTFTTAEQLMPRFSVANITRYGKNSQETASLSTSYYLIISTYCAKDGCVSELTMFSDALEWPETDIGQTVSLSCPCGDLSLGVGHPSAQRQCTSATATFTSGARWSNANDAACNFTRSTEELCQVPAEVRKTIAARISILKYGLLF